MTVVGSRFRTESRGLWVVAGPCWFEVHPYWWRLGVSVRAWAVGVYLGPFVVAAGKPRVTDRRDLALSLDVVKVEGGLDV